MVEPANYAAAPLALSPPRLEDIKEPFEGDVLDRRPLAERLTGYVSRLKCGAVIALDAPWGEGKSWFARHWAALLKNDGYRVGMIDAFREDYVEDPFLMLAAEVRRLSASDAGFTERFTAKAAKTFGAMAPAGLKLLINAGGKWLLGTSDVADLLSDHADVAEHAVERSAEMAEHYAKQKLEAYQAERESMEGFRGILGEFALRDKDRPVVIFVDELDRCRPAFAVALLERIKHFFDVPNLVFVLVMNRKQLEGAIQGVYGAQTNASDYLGKFLHLSLTLPKERSSLTHSESQAARFARATLARYGLSGDAGFLASSLAACVQIFDLSLRDVERVCALRFLSDLSWDGLLVCLGATRVKAPGVYAQLLLGHQDGVQGLLSLVQSREQIVRRSANTAVPEYLDVVIALLNMAAGSNGSVDQNVLVRGRKLLFGRDRDVDFTYALALVLRAARTLDLDVDTRSV